ncbi:MAG TPA: hypothetical protein VIH42_06375 [Thermoguttaceae bacterium]
MVNTLMLSTALFFGWVLNAPNNYTSQLAPEIAPPTSSLPLPPLQDTSSASKAKKTRSAVSDAQHRHTQLNQSKTARYGASGGSQQRNSQDASPMMPLAPTDSSENTQYKQIYQWLPPTAYSDPSDADTSGGRPSDLLDPTSLPTSPTRARPGMSGSYTSMRNAQIQNRRMEAARNAAAATPQLATKPFSGYRQPTSGVSPYMNLFRSNGLGTIDNYSTLVRPELEQGRMNQQFGAEIHGLENSTRVQGMTLQRLGRDTQNLQGVNANQFFMNYGDYYPGAR